MISIRVGSETYSLEESVSGASLGDLYALKMQTMTDGSPGVSVKTIQEMFIRMGELAGVEGFTAGDLLDDPVFLQNMIGLVFLARRSAGEKITLKDAEDVAFKDLEFIHDDYEAEAPLDVAEESAA